jgi:hypothetical protein
MLLTFVIDRVCSLTQMLPRYRTISVSPAHSMMSLTTADPRIFFKFISMDSVALQYRSNLTSLPMAFITIYLSLSIPLKSRVYR